MPASVPKSTKWEREGLRRATVRSESRTEARSGRAGRVTVQLLRYTRVAQGGARRIVLLGFFVQEDVRAGQTKQPCVWQWQASICDIQFVTRQQRTSVSVGSSRDGGRVIEDSEVECSVVLCNAAVMLRSNEPLSLTWEWRSFVKLRCLACGWRSRAGRFDQAPYCACSRISTVHT